MALYYVLYNEIRKGCRPFTKHKSLCSAMAAARLNEKRVYLKIPGIPNPWWMWGIKNSKVDKSKIYKEIPDWRLNRLDKLDPWDGLGKK